MEQIQAKHRQNNNQPEHQCHQVTDQKLPDTIKEKSSSYATLVAAKNAVSNDKFSP